MYLRGQTHRHPSGGSLRTVTKLIGTLPKRWWADHYLKKGRARGCGGCNKQDFPPWDRLRYKYRYDKLSSAPSCVVGYGRRRMHSRALGTHTRRKSSTPARRTKHETVRGACACCQSSSIRSERPMRYICQLIPHIHSVCLHPSRPTYLQVIKCFVPQPLVECSVFSFPSGDFEPQTWYCSEPCPTGSLLILCPKRVTALKPVPLHGDFAPQTRYCPKPCPAPRLVILRPEHDTGQYPVPLSAW